MVQPEVTIEQGSLRGSIGTNHDGKNFFKFQGIPYARPPLNDLRFKAPVPPEKWTGTLDATKEGDGCYSSDPLRKGTVSGSENCLFLNVFTKKVGQDTELLPVLVWIHGGGFVWGSSSEELYGPDFLLTEDVVLVTINYRLGLLGFVSFDDASLDVPGNAGLKDQVMALKWVKRNIDKFGGNPDNVTIFGESAGAASVHLLMLSPLAKGLFHRAIAQSGCALNPWVRSTRGASLLASALNLEDDKAIYNYLMEKSVEEIYEIQLKIPDKMAPGELRPLGFVLEKESEEAFLAEEPIDVILPGNFNHVQFMTGYTTAEGLIFELFKRPGLPDLPPFEDMVPWTFGYQDGKQEVADKIKKFYFGDEEYSPQTVLKKCEMFTDCQFVHGITLTLLLQSTISTYLYRMSADTDLNFFKKLLKIDLPGTSHCDDLGYLFTNFTTPEVKAGSIEDTSFRRFVKLWTNFAKYGNPTPDKNDELLKVVWKPVTGANLDFLDIGKDLVPLSNPDPERVAFWKQLFTESPAGQKLNVFT